MCKAAHYHLSKYRKNQACTSAVTRRQNSLVHAFVITKFENGNSLLLGITKTQITSLQRVQKTAARIVTRTRRREHMTPVLYSLHWPPFSYRVPYKILLFILKCLSEVAASYLTDLLRAYQPARQLNTLNASPPPHHLLTTSPPPHRAYNTLLHC